ncbi:hypothetical protein DNI29_04285 [Hymenobacter sediminis]|uniref:hypothetical protein n=1 Tax=Hymenobacter sediminis TaxID=2218621 RepID=UPI000F4D7AAF|nr:hypothetical protein [Hymenobacter sediminis]RPD50021.1 hypothetical protein DNI29_04285 [Hymenobacter sediminis]
MNTPRLNWILNTAVDPLNSNGRLSTPANCPTIRPWVVAPIECADGTTLSVQASNFHYCSPREDRGPYEAVEVGFPSCEVGSDWQPYKDSSEKADTDTVFGYVPVELVRAFIEAHGGEKV